MVDGDGRDGAVVRLMVMVETERWCAAVLTVFLDSSKYRRPK